jgi:hypothetical protein
VILFIYLLISVIWGGLDLLTGQIYVGIASIVAPALCVFGASGLKGSLIGSLVTRERHHLVIGILGSLIFVGGGLTLASHSEFDFSIFGVTIRGIYWCIAGVFLGWGLTTRRHVPLPAISKSPSLERAQAFLGMKVEEILSQFGQPLKVSHNESVKGPFKIYVFDETKGREKMFTIRDGEDVVSGGMYEGVIFDNEGVLFDTKDKS